MNIIINGATSGIGKAIVKELSQSQHRIVICGKNSIKMDELLSDTEKSSSIIFHSTFCVRNLFDIEKFVNRAHSLLGSIDVLINCVGLNSAKESVEELSFEQLDKMYEINFRAPAAFIQHSYRTMKNVRKGKIVNLHTTCCRFSNQNTAGYTSTKAAFDAFTGVLRKEARSLGVDVINVYPGGTNTEFRDKFVEGYMSARAVAKAIASLLTFDENTVPHELVIRPRIEQNYC